MRRNFPQRSRRKSCLKRQLFLLLAIRLRLLADSTFGPDRATAAGLKDLPSMHDIASTAVFLAFDMARRITGVTIDVTVGTTAALNYRTDKNFYEPNIPQIE